VAYDANARVKTQTLSNGATQYALTQYSNDALGRADCVAQRMNPAVYASLPASACTLGTAGSFGPDRIQQGVYDAVSDDCLAVVKPLLDRVGDFAAFLGSAENQQATCALRMAETTGRPFGEPAWIEQLERDSGRALAPKKRGPKPRQAISCI
jgi:hypothetical protein